jgi:PAS domain S-box-containing protein
MGRPMSQSNIQVLNTNDAYAISDLLLHSLALETAASSGTDFFYRLVEEVGRILQAEQVYVAECRDEDYPKAHSLAYWKQSGIAPNFTYSIDSTPCDIVHNHKEIRYYPQNLSLIFPKSAPRESYIGIPLEDSRGKVIGHFVVNHHHPTNFAPNVISALRIFALRAAAELERLRLEQAVMFSQEQFRVLFEHLPLAIAFCRPEGHVLRWNPSARNLFASDEIPMPMDLIEDKEAYETAFVEVASKETAWQQLEMRCRRLDGKAFWAQVTIFALRLSTQEQVAIVVIFEDISERRNAIEVLEERARLARDLHDAVSQTLWSASLIADVIPDLWQKDTERAQQRLEQLRQLNRMALAEMRSLLMDLRSKSQADTELGELLANLVGMTQSHSTIQFRFQSEGQVFPLEAPLQVGLYRIAQEALNNIVRHSQAAKATLTLSYQTDKLCLNIVDDGIGFDCEKHYAGHFGLKTMTERAKDLGLDFNLFSQAAQGTSIRIVWKG